MRNLITSKSTCPKGLGNCRPNTFGVRKARWLTQITVAAAVVLMLPGMGSLRSEYRYLAPGLHDAGYRAVTMDLRAGDSKRPLANVRRACGWK
jgi:alpha-beta hydrolase superfamily lysophospholipase